MAEPRKKKQEKKKKKKKQQLVKEEMNQLEQNKINPHPPHPLALKVDRLTEQSIFKGENQR